MALCACSLAREPEPDRTALPAPPFANPGERPGSPREGTPPAGILLIVIDTQRADHLGAYGSNRNLTPNLDEFALGAHVFEQATATSSWTRSSVASMFSGLYPTSVGVLTIEDMVPEQTLTLAELLREGGFQTYGVTASGNARSEFGFGQGFDEHVLADDLRRSYPGGVKESIAQGVNRHALRVLDARVRTRPFFLYLHYIDPHAPYLPHPELMDEPEPPGRFDGSMVQIRKLELIHQRMRFPEPDAPVEEPLVEADFERIKYLYASEVKYVDLWIGKLFRELQERGLWDALLIVVTADHGEMLWEHGGLGHAFSLHEPVIRVPLLVKQPRQAKGQGSRVAAPVSLIDLAPSLLGAAGLPVPKHFQGADWAPLLEGGSREPAREMAYSELGRFRAQFDSLREGNRKIIARRSTAGAQKTDLLFLYDLEADPSEDRNLVGKRRAGEPRLRALIERWRETVRAQKGETERKSLGEMDPDVVAELRALGYVE